MLASWIELGTYEKADEDVDSAWLTVLESFGDNTYLKIEAKGSWTATGSALPACGPDGFSGARIAEELLVVPSCRFGALLGKIGGSSASLVAPEAIGKFVAIAEPFAVGVCCMVKIPERSAGPLYLGFNVRPWPIRVTKLGVRIFGARPTGGPSDGS